VEESSAWTAGIGLEQLRNANNKRILAAEFTGLKSNEE
jgi:hypothetical protein